MLKILHDEGQIHEARRQLRRIGCDSGAGPRRKLFELSFALRFRMPPPAVAVEKSWDVLTMLETINAVRPDRGSQVYEMGSYNSEIPLALWSQGYRHIRASDLNPLGRCIRWYGNRIDFRCENFYAPDLPDGSVDVMTALSVIEHGYDQARLIALADRLLRPGGLLCLTTDYHEEKIPIPADFRVFDLPYQIFSRPEIESLISDAQAAGLRPAGELAWGPSEYPIQWLGHHFTNLFLAFVKGENGAAPRPA